MADVASRRDAGSGSAGGRQENGDRAQIMLVTALSLAILFVTLALILNTAIYTENLATRSSDIGGGTDAVRYHDATHDAVGGVIEYANYHNDTNHSTLLTALFAGVNDYQTASARQFALGDRAVEVLYRSRERGTRIVQTEESRDFTNRSGTDSSWTLASNVDNTRKFRMNVSDDDLLDTTYLLGNRFYVEIDNGSAQWKMYIYEDGTDITVEVENATGGGGTCTATGAGFVWINVTDGTVGGQDCQYLRFAEGVAGSYDITYHNPVEASGTYSLVVDDGSIAGGAPTQHLFEDGGGQPFATHAVYSATVDVVYETPRLYYETTIRVASGEPE